MSDVMGRGLVVSAGCLGSLDALVAKLRPTIDAADRAVADGHMTPKERLDHLREATRRSP